MSPGEACISWELGCPELGCQQPRRRTQTGFHFIEVGR